jgi:molecular chaperone DnaJ
MRDFYDILGVDKDSSKSDIKRAYRRIAMKYHPDKNPENKDAEGKFKEAAEAYSILSDDNKKAQYDRFGHNQFQNMGNGNMGSMDFEDIFSSFGDIFGGGFSDIFGSGRQTRQRQVGNLKISLELTLEEIHSGTSKTVKIQRLERTGKEPVRCQSCDGSGEVRKVQRSFLGQIVNVQQCLNCNGDGFTGGLEKKTTMIKVKVPNGVSNGNYIPLRGEGNQSNSGSQDGDLIVYFEEKEHKLFSRDHQDIYIDCFINYHQLINGSEIQVPTLSGNIKMKIPSGLLSGELLRLKGKGLPYINSTKNGDQFVRVNLLTPHNLSKKLKIILDELSTELGNEVLCKKFKD